MSRQSPGTSSYSPADLPVKRKRGRPRKDDSQVQGENSPVVPGSESVKKNKQIVGITNVTTDDMVGQVVSGVIEGSFEAGYLLNVKVDDTDTQLRGVVFLPGRVTPITPANDVAPNAKMYKRKEIPISVQNLQTQLRGLVPSSEQINKPATESKMDEPKFPDQVPSLEFQSGVTTAGENQSDSNKIPSADNLQTNETGPSFGEKVTLQKTLEPGLESQTSSITAGLSFGERVKLQQISEPGLESQTASITPVPSFGEKVMLQKISEPGLESQTASVMAQLKHHKVVELDKVQQSNMDIEASKESVPVTAPFVGITLCTENIIQEPHIERQALSCDLKPSDLVDNGVRCLNVEENQTAALTEPKSVNTDGNQTAALSEVKSLNMEDNQTAGISEVKSLNMEDNQTAGLSEAKSLNVEDNQTAGLSEVKCLNVEDNQTAGSTEVKSLNTEDNQAAVPPKPESMPSESIGIGFLMNNPGLEHNQIPLSAEPKSFPSQLIGTDITIEKQHSPRKETPETALLELSNMTTAGDNTSPCVSEVANFNATATGSYSAPMTSLPVMMFGREAIPCKPNLGTEGSVLPTIIETQICSSSATTNDADSDIKAAITNSHLDLSSGLNLSGSG